MSKPNLLMPFAIYLVGNISKVDGDGREVKFCLVI